jgi:tetratricopeptide (TPR) repeat protein
MPADQKQFSADSASREESLKRDRETQAAIQPRAGTDSAAAQPAFAPAIAAYKDLVVAAPEDADQATTLANLYAQAGRIGDVPGAFDSLLNHTGQIPPDQLVEIGRRLAQGGLWPTAARILNAALTTNPYHRQALYELGNGAVAKKDTATAVSAVQRLVAIDPGNVSALRLAAQAWDLRGRKDSAQHYHTLADSGRTVDISVASMVQTAQGVTLTAVATNLRTTPSQPFGLAFEFLDVKGTVVAGQVMDLTALPPSGNRQFEVKGNGNGIVGWRYHIR